MFSEAGVLWLHRTTLRRWFQRQQLEALRPAANVPAARSRRLRLSYVKSPQASDDIAPIRVAVSTNEVGSSAGTLTAIE